MDQVRQKLEALAIEQGLRLYDLRFVKEPHGKVLRSTIDKEKIASQSATDSENTMKSASLTLNECERFHKAAVFIVDCLDFDYFEVSSRGADRELETDADLDESIGKQVEIRLYKPLADHPALGKRFYGTLEGMIEGTLEGTLEGGSRAERTGTFDLLELTVAAQKIIISKKEISMIRLYVKAPQENMEDMNTK